MGNNKPRSGNITNTGLIDDNGDGNGNGNGDGGSNGNGGTRQCWEFFLERPTPAAQQVEPGEAVVGAFQGTAEIQVASVIRGTLGSVPQSVVKQIRSAIGNWSDVRLEGEVLTVRTPSAEIRLCLVDQ